MEEKEKNLPTNIKQIGTIPDGIKIYMEDYVNTYIQQYATCSLSEEKIAVLIGESYIMDGNRVTFISGAIKGKYSERNNGMITLTEKSMDYIRGQMEQYFKGLDIIGWVYIQPGYGDYLNEVHLQYHKDNFDNETNVLFLVDPVENISCFFTENPNTNELEGVGGYIIYYDKNEGMNEYMLNNRNVKVKADEKEKPLFKPEERDNENKINAMPRTNRMKGKIIAEQKRMVNLFGTLSAILFIVCFVMGAGLVQNDDRISKLEKQLTTVNDSYQYVLTQITSDKTQSVFAAENYNETTETPTIQATSTEITSTQPTTTEVTTSSQKTVSVMDTYTIKEGDNLNLISVKYFGDTSMVKKIMETNGIENQDTIYFGQELTIPSN